MLDFFFRDAPVMDEKAAKKFLVPDAAPRLARLPRRARDGRRRGREAALEASVERVARESGPRDEGRRAAGARRAHRSHREPGPLRGARRARPRRVARAARRAPPRSRSELTPCSLRPRVQSAATPPSALAAFIDDAASRSSRSRRCSSSCRSLWLFFRQHLARARRGRAPSTAARSSRRARSTTGRSSALVIVRARSSRCRSTTAAAASSTTTIAPKLDRVRPGAHQALQLLQVRRALRLRLVGRRRASSATCSSRSRSGRSSSAKDSLLDLGLRTKGFFDARVDLRAVPRGRPAGDARRQPRSPTSATTTRSTSTRRAAGSTSSRGRRCTSRSSSRSRCSSAASGSACSERASARAPSSRWPCRTA